MVSLTVLLGMMTLDALIHFYLVIIMILKQQGSAIDQLNVINHYINSPLGHYNQIIIQAFITGFFLCVAVSFLLIIEHTHTLATLNSIPNLKKSMTLGFVGIMTVLQIPIIELIAGTFLIDFDNVINVDTTAVIKGVLFFLASLNGVLLFIFAFILQKLFIIRIPSNLLHWSASNTQLHSMKLINKIALVACHLYITTVQDGAHHYFITIPLLLLFGLTGISRILLIPHYTKIVEWCIRLTELLTACLLLLLIVAQIITRDYKERQQTGGTSDSQVTNNADSFASSKDLIETKPDLGLCILISFVAIPCTICLAVVLDYTRQSQLWSKLENGTLRHEIEMEHALYILIQKVNRAIGYDEQSALAFADLLYLVDVHKRTCENHQCPCQRREIVQYLLNKGHTYGVKKIMLDEDEINLLNAAGSDNQFVKKGKNINSVKTLTLFQSFNFYQTSAAPQADMNRGVSDLNIQDGDKNMSPTKQQEEYLNVRVNIAALKVTFLNQFVEIYFEEARRRFPYSKRLFFQYAYFTLQCCKNRFMTETLLRNFEATNHQNSETDWMERVSVQVNELQTIMEIEKIADTKRGSMLQDDEELQQMSDAANWGVQYFGNGIANDNFDRNKGTNSGLYNSLLRFDPEYFIQISELTEFFYEQVEKLALSVSNFWKIIQSESLDVDHAKVESIALANVIATVYRVFKDIETATESGTGTSRSNDFRVCFTFALVQKFLLNDIISHELYVAKMNSQREMQRLIRNNMLTMAKGPEDTGFVLCHGQNRNFGEVILCNQIFRKNLGYSSKELKHINIVDFMPSLIKQWHQEFVNDFSKNGGASSNMLNRTSCMFMRQKSGYIIPAMISIRFHYSRDYDFTFVCFASFMQEIQINRTIGAGRHKVDEILFFLCDDQEGLIMDISETCYRQLGLPLSLVGNNPQTDFTSLILEDVCPTLSFQKLKAMRDESENLQGGNLMGNAMEEIVDVDLNVIARLKNNQMDRMERHINDHSKVQQALCQVFWEQYGAEKKRCMNIVALLLLDQLAMKDFLKKQRQAKHEKAKERQARKDRQDHKETSLKALLGQSEDQSVVQSNTGGGASDSHLSQSLSGSRGESQSSASHSQGGSSTEASVLKQMYSSTEMGTSSSLKLVTQLIFGIFLLLLALSTVNLVLSLNRYKDLEEEVMIVRRSYDRMANLAKVRTLLRGILIIANDYALSTREARRNRFKVLIQEYADEVNNLKDVQEYLDKATVGFSEELTDFMNQKSVNLRYLDPFNKDKSEMQTYSFAMNIFIQRASDILDWDIDRFTGNIRIMKLIPPPKDYIPSEYERQMYFLVMTAMGNIRQNSRTVSTLYREETEKNALDVAEKTQITIIISIAAIVLVCIIVSPIICRIEERKYMGLKFFLNVEHEHLTILEGQVQDFMQIAFQDNSMLTNTMQIETKSQEQKDRLKILMAQNQFFNSGENNDGNAISRSLGSSRDGKAQSSNSDNDYFSDSFDSNSSSGGQLPTNQQDLQMRSMHQQISTLHSIANRNIAEEAKEPIELNDVNFEISHAPKSKQQRSGKIKIAPINANIDMKNKTVNSLEDSQQSQISQGTQKIMLQDINKQRNNDKKLKRRNSDSEEDDEDENKHGENTLDKGPSFDEQTQRRKEVLELKFKRISQIIYRQKVKTTFLASFISIIFSSYFIAGYFFSVEPFSQTPTILTNLDLVFLKDYKLANIMSFIRDNYILNTTVPSVENPSISGADLYLDESSVSERAYLEMRKNVPSVLKSVKGYFSRLETDQCCDIAYQGVENLQERQELIDKCEKLYNGILLKGMTTGIDALLRHWFKVNMEFESITPSERTVEFIEKALADVTSLQMVDLKHVGIDMALKTLKDQMTVSTSNYYAELIQQYTALFCVFVVLMALLFLGYLIFGYSSLKDAMWKTNLTLKIMPLDFIPKHCLPELKAFFKF